VKLLKVERDGELLTFNVITPGGAQLGEESFRIKVNGLIATEVEIGPIRASIQPAGAVIVVDTSGSMQGPPMAAARDAVRLFIDTVDPTTEIGLVTFSDDVNDRVDYTTGHQGLRQRAAGLQASGETALNDALMAAVELADERAPQQRNIVLLTDGTDTSSTARFDQVKAAALVSEARIFIVGLKSPDYDPRSIRSLAASTNGKFLQTEHPKELSSLFQQVARTLVSRYRVAVINPDLLASVAEIHVQVLQERGIESGVGTFDIGLPALPPEEPSWSVESIPLSATMLLLFVALSLLVFLGIETLRARRDSPSGRIQWYVDAPGEVDKEAFVSAAVIERAKELATQLAQRAGFLERMESQLDAAGIKWRGGEVIVASAGLAFAGLVLGAALGGLPVAIIFGLIGGFGPISYINFKVSRRRAAFLGQLPDVLLLLSGALKAGHSIQQAMAAVGEDAKPPASQEFRRTMAEVRLGANLDDALEALGKRIGVLDFDWTILAIQIQREVGGNLAEILEIISETIREREKLQREIKALTAEGRMSGMVLGLLPVAMALLLFMRSPDYLRPLYTTSKGLTMIGFSSVMMILGFFWMKKIVKIEV
jgi:tight adherence protein B